MSKVFPVGSLGSTAIVWIIWPVTGLSRLPCGRRGADGSPGGKSRRAVLRGCRRVSAVRAQHQFALCHHSALHVLECFQACPRRDVAVTVAGVRSVKPFFALLNGFGAIFLTRFLRTSRIGIQLRVGVARICAWCLRLCSGEPGRGGSIFAQAPLLAEISGTTRQNSDRQCQ